jgi:hypothetical protein
MRPQILLLALIQFHLHDSLELGLIRNVSLIGLPSFQINQTSCSQCACLLTTTSAWVAFNCYLSNSTCQMITSYNTTTALTIQSHLHSNFFFRQLPPISTMTTGNFDAGNFTRTTRMITMNAKFEHSVATRIHALLYRPDQENSTRFVICHRNSKVNLFFLFNNSSDRTAKYDNSPFNYNDDNHSYYLNHEHNIHSTNAATTTTVTSTGTTTTISSTATTMTTTTATTTTTKTTSTTSATTTTTSITTVTTSTTTTTKTTSTTSATTTTTVTTTITSTTAATTTTVGRSQLYQSLRERNYLSLCRFVPKHRCWQMQFDLRY